VLISAVRAGGNFAAIVGAPRCGTTSLARYLTTHPDIDFSIVKEPHFFSQRNLTDLDDEQLAESVRLNYLARYFPRAEAGGRMRMEGSVTYLYASHQIEPILRVWPEAKFIIAVRDPFEMLPSLHQRLLFLGDETETDFARAWALAPERAQGRHIPRTCVEPRWLQYPEIGRFGKYVEQFLATVGRERCLVILFDDLIADPATVYRQVLAFLGLADDGRNDFPRERASRGYKLAWLQRLLKRPPIIMRSIMAGEKFRQRVRPIEMQRPDPWLVRRILGWRKRLLRWNEAPAPAAVLPPEIQDEMREVLTQDVLLLARLLGRDLSHWLGGVNAGAVEVAAK
jgi:sulfotransferase family protein